MWDQNQTLLAKVELPPPRKILSTPHPHTQLTLEQSHPGNHSTTLKDIVVILIIGKIELLDQFWLFLFTAVGLIVCIWVWVFAEAEGKCPSFIYLSLTSLVVSTSETGYSYSNLSTFQVRSLTNTLDIWIPDMFTFLHLKTTTNYDQD